MANLNLTQLMAKFVNHQLDLGTLPSAVVDRCDMNNRYSLLNRTTYNVSVVHTLDGLYDELVTIPEMADEKAGSILWVLITSGFFHRVRVSATEDFQIWHIRLLEATMVYQGQLS